MVENEAIKWLKKLEGFKIERYGLDGISSLLDRIDRPDANFEIIHVTGTNGKGSVSKICSEALIFSGKKTGLFISPHILSLNERIQVNGEFIADENLIKLIEFIRPFVEKLHEEGFFCSQFDVLTAIAFEHFRRSCCDVVVLEVGMGGRLDSTNAVLSSKISIFTKISIDHVKELGGILTEIAFEKAGIVKENSLCVCSELEPVEVFGVLKEVCRRKNAHLIKAYRFDYVDYGFDSTCVWFNNFKIKLGLKGSFQVENAAIALTAMLKFGLEFRFIKEAIEGARWPARFEIFKGRPCVVLDGAHNVDGIKALKAALVPCKLTPKVGVFSMLATKNYAGALKEISSMDFSKLIITQMNEKNVVKATILYEIAKSYGLNCVVVKNCSEAVEQAKSLATEDGVVVIFGSLYFAGQVRKFLIRS